jgi:hypothetical protein
MKQNKETIAACKVRPPAQRRLRHTCPAPASLSFSSLISSCIRFLLPSLSPPLFAKNSSQTKQPPSSSSHDVQRENKELRGQLTNQHQVIDKPKPGEMEQGSEELFKLQQFTNELRRRYDDIKQLAVKKTNNLEGRIDGRGRTLAHSPTFQALTKLFLFISCLTTKLFLSPATGRNHVNTSVESLKLSHKSGCVLSP